VTPFASIAEYEAFIFDLRHKQIVAVMDKRTSDMTSLYQENFPENIRCDCKVCQELWSAYG
jgi:hypothetical protein